MTRLILNCKGSAFMKLQQNQKELMENDKKSVKKMIELLGGHWGPIKMERRYEYAERALFKCSQKSDESADSYLARADIMWSDLTSRDIKLSDLQAYVTLRGSTLTPEDKKKVLIDADSVDDDTLSLKKVSSAIRMLGAGFFQEVTGSRRTKLKTYDQSTLLAAEENDDPEHPDILATDYEDQWEDDYIDTLIADGDQDAVLVADFEHAAADLIQGDEELAAIFNTYTEARRRLSEKFRSRGFWPVSKGKGKPKGKGRGRFSKGSNSSRRSLEHRILTSRCKICDKIGHWKAECPERHRQQGTGSLSSSAPTSMVVASGGTESAAFPLEFLSLPLDASTPLDMDATSHADQIAFTTHTITDSTRRCRQKLRDTYQRHQSQSNVTQYSVSSSHSQFQTHANMLKQRRARLRTEAKAEASSASKATACFATHGSFGVVDLGATKTVIGSNLVKDLIAHLDPEVRDRLTRCPCRITFRFGNHGTLTSQQALVIPLQGFKLKVAIVPGDTPFLISNTLLRAMKAVVDVHNYTLWSEHLHQSFPLELSSRGLFLIDINALAAGKGTHAKELAETHLAAGPCKKVSFAPDARTMKRVSLGTINPTESESGISKKHSGTSMTPEIQSQAQEVKATRATVPNQSRHVPCSPTEEHPAEHTRTSARDPSLLHGGDGGHDSGLRPETQGPLLRSGMERGSTMGDLVCEPLPEVNEGGTQDAPPLHRNEDRQGRAHGGTRDRQGDVEDREPRSKDASRHQEQEQGQSQGGSLSDDMVGSRASCSRSGDQCRGSLRLRHGDSEPDSARQCPASRESHVESGGYLAHSDPSSREPPGPTSSCPPGGMERAVKEADEWLLHAGDLDDPNEPSTVGEPQRNPERDKFLKLVRQYEQELQEHEQVLHHQRKGPKLDMLEVFCGSSSQLTHQCAQLGHRAQRLGKSQCDLQSTDGRKLLYKTLISSAPRHVWFSPVCGPWSAWANLNGSRSIEAWDQLQIQRWEHLSQVALGLVILRYQLKHDHHFHWEQPLNSQMIRLPYLRELHQATLAVIFDMCIAGSLRDPVSGKPIRKPMIVFTTSQRLVRLLEPQRCPGNHEHQVLEGTTRYQGNIVNRTEFSEHYTRKFARQVAKVLCGFSGHRDEVWKPYQWTLAGEPLAKRRRMTIAARPKNSRSTEITSDMPAKRTKLLGKQSVPTLLEQWTSIFDRVDSMLPRVGKITPKEPDLMEALQNLIPDKQIKFVVACRGSNRTMAPPTDCQPGMAPYRKCVYLERGTTKTHVEDQWENWETLSQRMLIRPSHSCRINITVFAANPSEPSLSEQATQQNQHERTRVMPNTTDSVGPVASQPTAGESSESRSFPEEETPNSLAPDGNSPWGSKTNITKEEKHMIEKCHKNLGHPTPERLHALLRQHGARSEVAQAALHYKCPICVQCCQPKHPRPATIKDDADFNDRVSVDGITWTSSQGQHYHFYHIIDWATNYHIAFISPSRNTEAFISGITQAWFLWAGVPAEMLVDAASELNSEAFESFAQQHNIKVTTTSPEAHHQNGKAERHGKVLQEMLKKFEVEHPIRGYQDLQQALWWCVQAKNASSLRKGYAPEVLVLGKHTRLPGSICSDNLLPAHILADSETAQGIQFRKQLAYRETARRAFHSADNDDTIRRALLRRSHPHRGTYSPGEWVMVWKEIPGNAHGTWIGPQKVIVHENQRTVWTTMSSKLYRSAPERVRPVTSLEAQEITITHNETPISEIAKHLPEQVYGDITQYRNMMPSNTPSVQSPPPPVELTNPNNNPSNNEVTVEPMETPSVPTSEGQPDQEPEASSQDNNPITGIDVPIPETSDDELTCEALYCNDVTPNALHERDPNLVWRQEVLVGDDDIKSWKQEDNPGEMAFLATAAKKQRVEVRLTDLSPAEKLEFQKAKESEVQNWLKTNTVKKVLRNQLAPEEILRCRWILTWKPLEPQDRDPQQPHKDRKAKARLVVLGYQDPLITEIPRDSPTLGRHSKMLLLQLISSMGWTLRSFDIRAAFLQGEPHPGRTLGLEPVPELAKAMGLTSQEVCQLAKSAYGLVDAPFRWFQTLKGELIRLGFEVSPFDTCMFILRHPVTREPEGILGIHVDDGIGAGNQRFLTKIKELEQKYPFGSHKVSAFAFTGIQMRQRPDFSIHMSQTEYINKINPIKISPERKTQEDLLVNEQERQQLRALIGSLQYAAVHTRPDLSARLSHLQSEINKATIQTLCDANRTLHEAKRHSDVSITIQPINCKDLRFLAFSDASFASKNNPNSHTGSIIMSTHRDIQNNVSCPVNPMSWGCKKIQKVVTSTLAAETVSLGTVLDQLSWIRLCWHWILDSSVKWQKPSETLQSLPESYSTATVRAADLPEGVAATDCKSLYDLVSRTAMPSCTEFRTMLQAKQIKEFLSENVQLRWVHSGAQLADALTKIMQTSFLRETLRLGQYRLNDELAVLKSRASNRNRMKWLKTCTSPNCDETCFLDVLCEDLVEQ